MELNFGGNTLWFAFTPTPQSSTFAADFLPSDLRVRNVIKAGIFTALELAAILIYLMSARSLIDSVGAAIVVDMVHVMGAVVSTGYLKGSQRCEF